MLPYSIHGRGKIEKFLNHSLAVNTIGYGLKSNNDYNIMFNMDIMWNNDFKYTANINENTDVYMNNAEAIAREAVKLTNIDMFICTYGFYTRPWSILQLMPRPIPICNISYDWPLINNTAIEGIYKYTKSYKLEDNNVFLVTNRDASKIFNNKIIHNCFYNKFTNEESDVYDGTVIIGIGQSYYTDSYMSSKYVNETALVMNSPKTRDILLRPTIISNITSNKYEISYGATSIEDWFKVMIELSTPNAVSSATVYADAYMDMLIGHTNYNNNVSHIPEVHNNPKGYKLVDFSYVKQDTEHPYINTMTFNPNNIPRTRYIFHPKPNNDINIENDNVSFIRNYLEDGRVMKTYVSSTGEVIKTIENSAYKGYLEGKPKFVDYVVSEITFASKLYNHKEFYFISAGLFESKEKAIGSNKDDYSPYDKFGDIFDAYKDIKGYKDLVDKGEIVKYPADKSVFDKDSVIKLIYSGNNYHTISDIRHLKWHAIEENNPTIVLDFERKYALDFVTPYSRNIIIPDLDRLVDYVFDKAIHRFLISDSSTWMEPAMYIAGDNNEEPNYIEGVGAVWQPDRRPQDSYLNSMYQSNGLNNEYDTMLWSSSEQNLNVSSSRLYYALLMHDIYNNKKNDGYAVRQELYNPDDIIKYKYVRYPDNDAIDKFVNIHMYNNTVVTSDGETAVHLKASRFDYRFHPTSIHVKIFGYNMYDLLFKATSIFDLHSNAANMWAIKNDKRVDYNIVYRWKLDNDVTTRVGRRFNYSIGLKLSEEAKSIEITNKDAYLKDSNKYISIISPNIYHNFGMVNNNEYRQYLANGDIYRPVMFNDEDIQGLNLKNSPADTFYTSENRTFMNHSTNNNAYKLINPYALVERNNGTPTGITFEDIFRKAWDPYTGHRFTGKSALMSGLKYLYVTNLYNHYADPYNITTNWMLRVSKNSIHFGGAWSDERLVNDPNLINKSLNLIEQGLPQDPISAGSERYRESLDNAHPTIINQFDAKNKAVAEHPMHIRYMCHPFQRTCLILIRLVSDNPATGASSSSMNTIKLPVYMGYVNIRYEEIDKRKHDINLLRDYIKECAFREDSGYKYYLKSFKYPYIFNHSTNKLFAFDVLENDPLDIRVTYVEDHNSANPSYQFSAEFVLRAHIIGEDVRKPENADICDNRSLQYDGGNAIILYMIDLKKLGAITKRVGDNNLSNEEFYDGFKFLSTHSLERIDAAPKYNIPEYFVHKYSIFNGVKRFGWSAYNGQYLPKWPTFIPDNVTMLVSQNLFSIKDATNANTLIRYDSDIKPLKLLNTNIMLHPNFIGGIKDRKNEYVKFDSTKFYGSINIVDVSNNVGESFANVNPKLTGFEYLSNRIYDIQRPGKERANATVTETSGMALSFYYIKYSMTTIASKQSKWFKQRAYDQIHDVFMHKEDYGKSTIHNSVPATTTPQEYLNKVYNTLNQPSLSSKGVSNFNLWDDGSSIGFRMDLNPTSINIVYATERFAPTAIQWNFPMIYRKDTDIDFYKQRKYWTAFKNYEINEIAFNPYDSSGELPSYMPWK